jgi:hypothetical protein
MSIIELIVDEVHRVMGAPSVPYSVGRLKAESMAERWRVSWVPGSFSTGPVKVTNPLKCPDGKIRTALYQETWTIECHISAASFEAAELLRARIMTAVKAVMLTTSRPTGGVWITQEDPSVAYGGTEKVIMAFEWDLLVFPPEPQTPHIATIQTIETTAQPSAENSTDAETVTVTAPP